jgi:hypothetical protein
MKARGRLRAAATAATLFAAGCQPLPHPFADDVPPRNSPMWKLRDTASVTIAPIEGGPRATAVKLAPAIATALQQHDIAASDRTASSGSYELHGRIQEMPAFHGEAALVVLWRLCDPAGKQVGVRAERVLAAPQDWQDGSDSAVNRVAVASADGLARLLEDNPPVESKVPGPARLAVHVGGALRDAGDSLARAIALVLQRRGLKIVTASETKRDFALDAVVEIGKPRAGKQHVSIVWHLRRPDGGEIGTVTQENDVPTGLLDGPWGDVAYVVATAAEDGIMRLIDRAGLPLGKS